MFAPPCGNADESNLREHSFPKVDTDYFLQTYHHTSYIVGHGDKSYNNTLFTDGIGMGDQAKSLLARHMKANFIKKKLYYAFF